MARYPFAGGAGVVGTGTRPQLLCARSCELAFCVVGAVQGAPRASVRGVRGKALSLPRLPVLQACGRSSPATGCGCGVEAWGPAPPSPRAALQPLPSVGCVVCLGTLSRAVVRWLLCVLPGFATPRGRGCLAPVCVPSLWPAACLSGVPRGPALVRRASSRPVAPGAPVAFGVAVVPSPRIYWAAAQGTWRPAGNPAYGARCWPPPRKGRWARSALYPFRALLWGCPWWVPPALVLGSLHCGSWACVDTVTQASAFLYRPSFNRRLGRCTGAIWCRRQHLPFSVRGRHTRVPCVSARACYFLAGSGRSTSRVRFSASHLSFGCFLRFSRSALSVLGLASSCCIFLLCPSLNPLMLAPPLSPAFSAFWPWVPLALVLCIFFAPTLPSLLLFFPPVRCAIVVSGYGVPMFRT